MTNINRKKRKVFLFFMIAVLSLSLSASSQEVSELNTSGSDNMDENFNQAEKPDDSYLAKFHAQDVAAKLIKRNLDQIYLLNVIVNNFPDNGWKEDYDKIYEEYKRAIELYYKRNVIFARVWFERNQNSISELMKKMSDKYKEDTQSIMDECHKHVVALHLNQETRSDPNKNRELLNNQSRIMIAYGQMDDADNAYMAKNYEQTLYHYRVAKTYGIKILETVAYTDEAEKKEGGITIKEVKENYKFHKADNKNRIYEDVKSPQDGGAATK
jgi:hypothetical protein